MLGSRKMKKTILALAAGIVIVVAVTVNILNTKARQQIQDQYQSSLSNGDFVTAVSMYKQHYVDNKSNRMMLEDSLSFYLAKLEEQGKEGRISEDEWFSRLDAIPDTGLASLDARRDEVRSLAVLSREFRTSLEQGDFRKALTVYADHFSQEQAKTDAVRQALQDELDHLRQNYRDGSLTARSYYTQISYLAEIGHATRVMPELEAMLEQAESEYVRETLVKAEDIPAMGETDYSSYLESVTLLEEAMQNVGQKPELVSAHESYMNRYVEALLAYSDSLISNREIARAVELLEEGLARSGRQDVLERINSLESLKPLKELPAEDGLYIKAEDGYYRLTKGDRKGTLNGVFKDNDEVIISLLPSDTLISVGYSRETFDVYRVESTGYIMKYTVKKGSLKSVPRLEVNNGAFIWGPTVYEFVDGKPVTDDFFDRLIKFDVEYDTWSYIEGEKGEQLTFGMFSGTEYVEDTYTVDRKYYKLDYKRKTLFGQAPGGIIRLPVTRTMEGYFIVDTSQLTSGNTYFFYNTNQLITVK